MLIPLQNAAIGSVINGRIFFRISWASPRSFQIPFTGKTTPRPG